MSLQPADPTSRSDSHSPITSSPRVTARAFRVRPFADNVPRQMLLNTYCASMECALPPRLDVSSLLLGSRYLVGSHDQSVIRCPAEDQDAHMNPAFPILAKHFILP